MRAIRFIHNTVKSEISDQNCNCIYDYKTAAETRRWLLNIKVVYLSN